MRIATIYDFHGTLADVSPILPLVQGKKYDEFYEASLSCNPIQPTVLAARRSQQEDHVNLLLTGMPRRYESGLRSWLKFHEVPIHVLYMRELTDRYNKDFVVKRRMYNDLVGRGFYVVRAWEDSPGVIDLWKSLGIDHVEVVPRVCIETSQVDTDAATS